HLGLRRDQFEFLLEFGHIGRGRGLGRILGQLRRRGRSRRPDAQAGQRRTTCQTKMRLHERLLGVSRACIPRWVGGRQPPVGRPSSASSGVLLQRSVPWTEVLYPEIKKEKIWRRSAKRRVKKMASVE